MKHDCEKTLNDIVMEDVEVMTDHQKDDWLERFKEALKNKMWEDVDNIISEVAYGKTTIH